MESFLISRELCSNIKALATITGEPPFTRVGMDFFGPIEVKRVSFSRVLSIRAIHLELVCSLDTDSCINAIRRFVARRGPVKVIKSDNGNDGILGLFCAHCLG